MTRLSYRYLLTYRTIPEFVLCALSRGITLNRPSSFDFTLKKATKGLKPSPNKATFEPHGWCHTIDRATETGYANCVLSFMAIGMPNLVWFIWCRKPTLTTSFVFDLTLEKGYLYVNLVGLYTHFVACTTGSCHKKHSFSTKILDPTAEL